MDQSRVKLAAAAAALFVGGILVALALAGQSEPSEFASGGQVPPRQETDLDRAARNASCELREFSEEGDGETAEPVEYRSDPPHSGPHHPEVAQDGAYYADPPAAPSIVHALRHGRIVIWFDPNLGEDEKADLYALFQEDSPHMMMAPRGSMPYEVAATAWTRRLGCERFETASFDALRAFRERYRDRGPEFVP
jgi:Protein of unknown function (DUF3105)